MSLRWLQEIREFEECAFSRKFPSLRDQKKAMTFAARSCTDENIRSILVSSIDHIRHHPDWVSGAILKARGHVDTMIENRPANFYSKDEGRR